MVEKMKYIEKADTEKNEIVSTTKELLKNIDVVENAESEI